MTAMPHILLTRGDPLLAEAALAVLPDAEVLQLGAVLPDLAGEPAWCFIDWLLDDISGLELCRRLRAAPATRASHITMVIEGSDQSARARALAAGADDYIPGPLTPEALAERLQLYTGAIAAPVPLRSPSGLTVDAEAHQARWQGKLIPLRPRELRLLQLFLANPDRLLSRAKIIALLGKEGEIGDDRTVDVWVGRLRRTLEAHGVTGVLRTVRSLGYVFDTPELP